jgi:hypothetical protein
VGAWRSAGQAKTVFIKVLLENNQNINRVSSETLSQSSLLDTRIGFYSLGLLGLELLNLLLLEAGGLGEIEGDNVGGQLVVSVSNGVKTGSHDLNIEGVKADLVVLLAFNSDANETAGNTGGGNNVVEDSSVDSGESAGAGSLLGSMVNS